MILAGSPAGKVGCADIKGPFFIFRVPQENNGHLANEAYNVPMDVRTAKQAIYGALFLIIVVGIIAGVYFSFFRVTASCFDGIQNQGETGIDCGGPCATVCAPANLHDIVVGSVQSFASGPGHTTFLAEVENHNTGFAIRSFGYEFILYDASGNAIATVSGQSFIYAGEVKYIVLPNEATSAPVDHASLVIQNPAWTPAATLGLVPQFGNPLTITGGTVSSSTATVTGRITDGDVSSFTNILIVAIFYGVDGNPVGASQTELDAIAPNQTESFSVMYPAVPNMDPSLTKAYAYALRP